MRHEKTSLKLSVRVIIQDTLKTVQAATVVPLGCSTELEISPITEDSVHFGHRVLKIPARFDLKAS